MITKEHQMLIDKDYFHFLRAMAKELKREYDAVEFGDKERDDRGMIISRYASMLEEADSEKEVEV